MLSLALKRLFDIAASCIGLLLLAPVLLGIAVWIKRDSPGPVFFRQQRIGRHGEPFRIYKFRSMRQDNAGLQITVGADDRITRSGHFIRAYKLDELPQLINVLLGDMSIVGPRPEVPRYVALYPADVRAEVLSVRPGITDLASVQYRSESTLLAQSSNPEQTYVDTILPAKLALCRQYVRERSFWLDLRIIGMTLGILLKP
ncbi:sugar transferase [Brachymonas denitrificans]|jgi:lipopolysaccharide/colanic/teichoic acid biosynthesis glycosyltransferase|uniref:Sugar transferase involved in LPS biosynthesis (Colanic, teichoic acid) n=1 Tax=Brachymonas denitrificans DSM 15123 TaxID=1121117 RepID=A0A1H8JW03_9BURK|nr:sugar transferase [Brachymonas denitrificans]SEN84890.1 Sugar transferase involved in LPS biosynthesis (colanic, teichoic acid) [Brachymonas denitrificans DSM 15123]